MARKRSTRPSRGIDRRVLSLARSLRSYLPFLGPVISAMSDAEGVGLLRQTELRPPVTSFSVGRVVWSCPSLGYYKVQLAGLAAPAICGAISEHSSLPLGPKSLGSYAPGTEVLVFRNDTRPYGVILGALPRPALAAHIYGQSDLLLVGMGGGIYRDPVHRDPFTRLGEDGGAYHFGDHRPMDILSTGEFGRISPTGVGLLVGDYETFLRVNEVCGLFLNYLDSHTRLAGWNFDWETSGTQRQIRLDQGEIYDVEGFGPYLWEGLGSYLPQGRGARDVDGKEVFFDGKPYGRLDLPEDELDRVPFWRTQIYRGYLGQGEQRFVVLPPLSATGFKRLSDSRSPVGVFREVIGLDGSYVLESAKQIFLAKRCLIPVPVQQRLPEDAADGDGAQGQEYKFAGQYGSGAVPAVEEWSGRDGADGALKTAAAVSDVLARLLNWQTLHAFAAHKKDWKVSEESAGNGPLRSNSSPLDLAAAATGTGIPSPEPKKLDVDHRIKQVAYFENEAVIALLDDGGIVLGDGYGAQIKMVGGQIFLDAPGGVHIRSGGTSSIQAGKDLILKARGSVDATTTEGDVRVKAQRNFHVLAGNDDQTGVGGILLESRGEGFSLTNGNQPLIGTDQVTGGIVLKATKGPLLGMAGEIYLKTGSSSGGVGEGPITLDAANGRQDIVTHSSSVRRYMAAAAIDSFGSNGQVTATQISSNAGLVVSGGLVVGGIVQALSPGVSLVAAGGMQIASGGYAAPRGNTEIGPIDDLSLSNIREENNRVRSTINQARQDGRQQWAQTFSQRLYLSPTGYGSAPFQQGVAFTFRDTPEQYGTRGFTTPEPHWFRLARESGYEGSPWKERPVSSPLTAALFPFPGKEALERPSLLRYKGTLVSQTGHVAVDRGEDGGLYKSPSFEGSLEAVPLNSNWKALS